VRSEAPSQPADLTRLGHRPDALRVLAWPLHIESDGNPYVELLYGAVARTGDADLEMFTKRRLVSRRWDIVHLHWPEWAVRRDSPLVSARDTGEFITLLRLARARGARVVWTAHDLRPHDAQGFPAIDRFMRLFATQVDYLVGLSAASLHDVRQVYPQLRRVGSTVVPHGHYRGAYPDAGLEKRQARQMLGIADDARTLVMLGQIRPYKNAVALIEAFRRVADPGDRLVVAGRPIDGSLERQVTGAAAGDERVILHLSHVPDGEVQRYLRAADVVMLPYRAVLNSGAALLALSFDRPIVAPSLGSFRELVGAVGEEWVRTYEGDLSDQVVEDALVRPVPSGRAPLAELEWDRLAALTIAAYRAAVSRRR
jgi:beta-1,4-mannosyltransferase